MTLLRRAISHTLDAVFPPKCVGCATFGAFICDACTETAQRAVGDRCPRCWLARESSRSRGFPTSACQDCADHTPAFAALRSAFVYRDAARNAVLALKFEGVSALAPHMAGLMHDTLRAWSPPVDVIVPVPLGWLRRRTRGYNQSELLAREVSRLSGIPTETLALRRRRQTPAQARRRDAASRRENMRDAFAPGKRPVTGTALLIDDVATTGATLDACARALLVSGATAVYALTFARED